MAQYEHLTPHNVALKDAVRIGVYDSNDRKIGQIPLGNLRLKNTGEKLYTFGVLSDVHVNNKGGNSDTHFAEAMEYLANSNDVEFICICGDLVDTGSDENHWNKYKYIIDTYSKGKPVYAATGNHESYSAYGPVYNTYGGLGLDVINTFMYGGDVFITLVCQRYGKVDGVEAQTYSVDNLKKMHEILETNRNRRCFVFQHIKPDVGHLDYHIKDIENSCYLPLSIFQHYKNITVFHGHSHYSFNYQLSGWVVYDESLGYRSVHVPTTMNEVCECYVADVYENGVHLRGYRFERRTVATDFEDGIPNDGQFVPCGSYWVNTELTDVEADGFWK